MLLQAASATEPTFLSVTTTGWIAIGAVVTALMALATGYLALKSRSEASAARDTVAEIQKDRELTFRPYISWKLVDGKFVNGVNLGKGPALNTVFCGVEEDEVHWGFVQAAPVLPSWSTSAQVKKSRARTCWR